jgi:hypothetical protein
MKRITMGMVSITARAQASGVFLGVVMGLLVPLPVTVAQLSSAAHPVT